MPPTTVPVVLGRALWFTPFLTRLDSSLLCDTAHLPAETFSRGTRTDMAALTIEIPQGTITIDLPLYENFSL